MESNFCRNPTGDYDTIWCLTTNPDSRWEWCDPIDKGIYGVRLKFSDIECGIGSLSEK